MTARKEIVAFGAPSADHGFLLRARNAGTPGSRSAGFQPASIIQGTKPVCTRSWHRQMGLPCIPCSERGNLLTL
jgi:hypothetical protein